MEELDHSNEPLLKNLRVIIRFAVRFLAIMMTAVILWGVVDVGREIYSKLTTPPLYMLTINDMLATFGAFMAVLIAIEILINITIYLRSDIIHVKIVVATALMAIARKVIVLDFNQLTPDYVWAIAAVVLAMSVAYYMVGKNTESTTVSCALPESVSGPSEAGPSRKQASGPGKNI